MRPASRENCCMCSSSARAMTLTSMSVNWNVSLLGFEGTFKTKTIAMDLWQYPLLSGELADENNWIIVFQVDVKRQRPQPLCRKT